MVLQEPEDREEETLQETKEDILPLKDMLVELNNGQWVLTLLRQEPEAEAAQ